jgi:hypothetical protein
MSAISLRLPDSLHRSVRELAGKEHSSINQIITLALAEKVSALMAEEILGRRAKRASRAKFMKAMSRVGKNEPEPADQFHSLYELAAEKVPAVQEKKTSYRKKR